MTGYWLGLIGVWLFCDAWISLSLYIPQKESWLRCHSIRIIRGLLGLALMWMGYSLI